MRSFPCFILLLLLSICMASCESSVSADKALTAGIHEAEALKEVPAAQVSLGQVMVRFNKVTDTQALGEIQTSLHNLSEQNMKLHLSYSLSDGQGNIQRFKTQQQELEAGEHLSKTKMIQVLDPITWSPDNPEQYQITLKVIVDGAQVDSHEVQASIRLIENTETAFNQQGLDINCMPQSNAVVR